MRKAGFAGRKVDAAQCMQAESDIVFGQAFISAHADSLQGEKTMEHTLPALPYAMDALQPHMS
ncbi:MAG: hypothetical protein Q8J90_05505, partial [Gallionella sp.]|nr:hypothetical protein [Gallionella sp.]